MTLPEGLYDLLITERLAASMGGDSALTEVLTTAQARPGAVPAPAGGLRAFDGLDDVERAVFMRYFDLYLQRVGAEGHHGIDSQLRGLRASGRSV